MKKNRIIQGLRALAVLSVIFYHTGFTWIPGGFLGVDVFFVISGYLISGIIIREIKATNRFDFKGFYAKRVRRLVPAASIVMIFTLIVGHHLISPLRIKNLGLDSLSATFYGANFRFYYSQIDYLNLGQQPSLFLHFWSLAVEEQFYILWPLLLLLAWRISRKYGLQVFLLFAFFISFLYSLNISYSNPTLAFYSIFTRSWEFAVGMLSYLLFSKIRISSDALRSVLGVFGLTGLVASLLLVKSSDAIPGWIVLFPVFSTALILGISTQGNFLGFRFFDNRLSNWVGSISYSLYLWHWPIYLLLAEVLGKKPFGIYILEFFVLTTLSSAIVYYVLELPIRNYQRIARKHGLAFFWGGIFSTISALIAFNLLGIQVFPAAQKSAASPAGLVKGADPGAGPSAGQITRSKSQPITLTDTINATKITNISSHCQKDVAVVIAVDCMTGSITSKKVIVLFGDSHAGQWEVPLGNFSTSHQFKVYNFLKSGCGAAELTYRYGPTGLVPYPQCPQYRASAIARIIALKPQLLVVSTSSYRSDAANSSNKDAFWESAYAPLLTKMRKAGIKVLILGDTPYPKNNIPDCLSQNLSDVAKCDFKVSDGVSKFHQTENFANWVSAQGGFFFNPTPLLCNEVTCFVVIDSIIVYRDGSHLSDLYSQKLFSAIEPTLNDSLGQDSAGLISPTNAPVVKPSITPSSASASSEKIVASSGTVTLAQLKSAYFAGTCMNTREAKIATPCIVGDKLSNKSLVLFGDSHAGQWQEALNSIGLSLGYRLYVFNKSGCPSADVYVDNITTRAHEYPACPLWRANAISQIRALKIKPSLIIIASLGQYSGSPSTQAASSAQSYSNWVSGLTSTTNKLGSDPKRIVILADTPFPITNVVDCLSKNLLKPAKCDLKRKVAVGYNNRIFAIQKVSQTLGNPYIDPTEWLCNTTICPAVIGKTIAYADNSHISREMSVKLIPEMTAALAVALSK